MHIGLVEVNNLVYCMQLQSKFSRVVTFYRSTSNCEGLLWGKEVPCSLLWGKEVPCSLLWGKEVPCSLLQWGSECP